jgi:hypothetical protein
MVRLRDDPSDTDVIFEGGSKQEYLTAVLEENDYRCETCGTSIFEAGLFAKDEVTPSSARDGPLMFRTAAATLECASCADGTGLHVGFPKSDEALKRMRAALHETPTDDDVESTDDPPDAADSSTDTAAAANSPDQPETDYQEIRYKTPWTYHGPHEVTKPSHPALGTEIESKHLVGGQDEAETDQRESPSEDSGIIDGDPRTPPADSAEDAGQPEEGAGGSLADRVRAALARLAR